MKRQTIPFKSLLERVLPTDKLSASEQARISRALEEADDRTLEALGLELLDRLVAQGDFRLIEEILQGDEKVLRYRDLTTGNTVAVVLPVTDEDEGIFRVPLPLRDWRGSTTLDQIRILFGLYDKTLTQDSQQVRGPVEIMRQVMLTGSQILRAEKVTFWAPEIEEGQPALAEINTPAYDEEMALHWVLDQNYLVYLPSLPAQIDPKTRELETEYQSLAMIPVGRLEDPVRGVLHIWSKSPFHFNEDRQGLLSLLSDCATDLLRRSQHLENLVFVDAGTNVYNRSYFNLQLQNEIARAKREDQSLALAIADIDDFRGVNSRYGYEAGNQVLATAAQVLKSGLRPFDSVARWGGEEFALILTSPVTLIDAQAVCERLRLAVELSRLTLTGLAGESVTTSLTVSIGGAIYPQDGASADTLWRAANAALVHAKKAGKNRVVFASELNAAPSKEESPE